MTNNPVVPYLQDIFPMFTNKYNDFVGFRNTIEVQRFKLDLDRYSPTLSIQQRCNYGENHLVSYFEYNCKKSCITLRSDDGLYYILEDKDEGYSNAGTLEYLAPIFKEKILEKLNAN